MHVTMHIQPQMKGKIATEESGHQTNSDSTTPILANLSENMSKSHLQLLHKIRQFFQRKIQK